MLLKEWDWDLSAYLHIRFLRVMPAKWLTYVQGNHWTAIQLILTNLSDAIWSIPSPPPTHRSAAHALLLLLH